ncbi:TetR/AcrR family transcriptional regulator [Streptomyces sp. NPDC096142]|uniref:TetR/AcrR family transcriptional regulator n=1 Tax=Streptomyces sp. NPDC096142 TaxID=3366077 RepID=UPI0038183099
MTETTSGRGYHHGDLRAALLAAARELLAEHGIAQFSVAALAKRVGVSSAAPYRHFADRQTLLTAVAADAADRLREQIEAAVADAGPDPVDRLATAAGVYTRLRIDEGIGLDVILQPGLDDPSYTDLHEHTRPLMDTLMALTLDAVGPQEGYRRALVLLEDVLALAHGYSAMQRDGAFSHHQYTSADLEAKSRAAAAVLAGAEPDPDRNPVHL